MLLRQQLGKPNRKIFGRRSEALGDLAGLGRRGGREGRAWRGTVWVGEGVGYIFTRPSIGNASAYGQTITYTGREVEC